MPIERLGEAGNPPGLTSELAEAWKPSSNFVATGTVMSAASSKKPTAIPVITVKKMAAQYGWL